VTNKVTAYGQKIHDSYSRFPCITVANSSITEYLPMSVCVIATGQRVQLSLLEEMKVLSKPDSEIINCKVRDSLRQMQDTQSDYGLRFLRESMSSRTLIAFNIKINDTTDDKPTIARIERQAKTTASIGARSLMQERRISVDPLNSTLAGIPITVYLFTPAEHVGLHDIVKRLFATYGIQPSEVRGAFSLPKGDRLKKVVADATALVRDREDGSRGIVFGIWSQAHNTDTAADNVVRSVYQKIKSFCNVDGMCNIAAISVENLGLSQERPTDIKKIGRAMRKLLAKRAFLTINTVPADSGNISSAIALTIYVSAIPDLESKKQQKPQESNSQCRVRKRSLARSFLVTFALSDGKPDSSCSTKTVLQIWKNPECAGFSYQADSLMYPGTHELDDATKENVLSFLNANIKTNQQVNVLRAGVRSSEPASEPGRQLKAEVAFWKDWAKRCGVNLSYYSVSSSPRAHFSKVDRETPPHTGLTNGHHLAQPISEVTLLIQPSFPGMDEWLLQKQSAKGSQPRSLSLTAHFREPTSKHLLGSDALVSAVSWNFPPSTWSSKELAPVYVARKATKAIVRKFDAAAKGGPAMASDYSAKKLQKFQDEVKYPIYLD
jgi:hypothetical protein